MVSEDESPASDDSRKRKVATKLEYNHSEPQPAKRSRPATGSGFNLVSYDLDNDEVDSESEGGHSPADLTIPSITNNNPEDVDAIAALSSVASDGGPLTVLSSAHIEAAHASPALPLEDTQTADKEQTTNIQSSQTSSPMDKTDHISTEVTLPPEPTELCSMHLQDTVEITLRRMRHDIGFDPNRVIQDNKAFRNPR